MVACAQLYTALIETAKFDRLRALFETISAVFLDAISSLDASTLALIESENITGEAKRVVSFIKLRYLKFNKIIIFLWVFLFISCSQNSEVHFPCLIIKVSLQNQYLQLFEIAGTNEASWEDVDSELQLSSGSNDTGFGNLRIR